MSNRSPLSSARTQLVTALAVAGALLGGAAAAHAAWQHAHGDSDNTGFAQVDTVPASQPSNVSWLGRVAPGANPVVAPDGTVYIGNMSGELKAFRPDGTPYWQRQVNPEHGGFYSSPVVGADGSIYIVSSKPREANNTRHDSFLHKFLPGGGWLGGHPFPVHGTDGGATSAPPNIWRHNGQEVIIVPAKYTHYSFERRLIAFSSTQMHVMSDVLVSFTPIEITGGGSWTASCIFWGWWNFGLGCLLANPGFDSPSGPPPTSSVDKAGYPMAGVAMQRSRVVGGPPTIMVADGKHDRVGYSFSMTSGLTEISRITDEDYFLTSPPVALPDGSTVTGTEAGSLLYNKGSSRSYWGAVGPLGKLTAAPTRLPGGNLAVVSREGLVTIVRGQSILYGHNLASPSIASAAASCKHFFVSTERELVTYDAKSPGIWAVARYYWQKPYAEGGLHAPVIGPTGYVYVVMRYSQAGEEALYVFPRPATGGGGTTQGCT